MPPDLAQKFLMALNARMLLALHVSAVGGGRRAAEQAHQSEDDGRDEVLHICWFWGSCKCDAIFLWST